MQFCSLRCVFFQVPIYSSSHLIISTLDRQGRANTSCSSECSANSCQDSVRFHLTSQKLNCLFDIYKPLQQRYSQIRQIQPSQESTTPPHPYTYQQKLKKQQQQEQRKTHLVTHPQIIITINTLFANFTKYNPTYHHGGQCVREGGYVSIVLYGCCIIVLFRRCIQRERDRCMLVFNEEE